MKLIASATILLAFAVSLPTHALNVESKCSLTVKSNTPLVVQTIITNDDCTKSVNVQKVVAGLVGNGGGSIGVQGPFVRELSNPKTVPKATCKTYPGCTYSPQFCSYVVKPGSLTLSLGVVSKTPATLNNTLALASTGVMQANGKVDMGACYLTVVP
jgi:hypothetical protein